MKHGSCSFLKPHAALIYKEFKEATSYCIDVKKLRGGMSFTDRKWYNNQDGRYSIKPGCRNQKVLPTGYDITSGGPVRSTHTHTHTSRRWTHTRGRHITHRERRMLQFWARRPSMTESSLTFLELSASSSVSFCLESQKRYISLKSNFKYQV